jgi:hypothetical protein
MQDLIPGLENIWSSHGLNFPSAVGCDSQPQLPRQAWCGIQQALHYGTAKDFAVLVVPPALVTAILPVVAPGGTVALM